MRRLVIPLVALSVWLAAGAGAELQLVAAVPMEQQALLPPTRFWGDLSINGRSAAVGVSVTAFIGGIECGKRVTTDSGRYWVDVLSSTERPDCGQDGAMVRFQVEGAPSSLQGRWQAGMFVNLDLFITVARLPDPETAD
ncbi:MAG: hypothetical protein HYX51_07770 [Chloroflexi bacterium]|nr:hypothetical protein [Chloroflexota bacterium]